MLLNPVETARQRAADLFATAARHPDLTPHSVIECLCAEASLGVVGMPDFAALDLYTGDELITAAVRTLGNLSFEEWRQPGIPAATRYGQDALRG